MTSEQRSTALKKYFLPTPPKPKHAAQIFWMIVGGLLLLGSFASGLMTVVEDVDGGVLCCSGIAFFVGGGIFLTNLISFYTTESKYRAEYRKAEPKPSDEQVDSWFAQDKQYIIKDAIRKLDLEEEQIVNIDAPLVVVGPQSLAKFKIGKDGIIRFSAYEIVVIYLTNYHLGAYSCEWDFVRSRVINEQTQEYHYTDVVSVATLTSNSNFSLVTPDGKEHPIKRHQQFSLSVASGESIKITVNFPEVEKIFKEGKLQPTGADRAIQVLRSMLREKKGGSRM
ncbi:MAG: hypothetical protein GXO35_05235 [Gammaproteobacteria bacterium]|nr:hypothetical protein [Gammaproteobacteria bacterium]